MSAHQDDNFNNNEWTNDSNDAEDEQWAGYEFMDGDFIGDILQDNKPEHTTRVYFHNLNGLKSGIATAARGLWSAKRWRGYRRTSHAFQKSIKTRKTIQSEKR